MPAGDAYTWLLFLATEGVQTQHQCSACHSSMGDPTQQDSLCCVCSVQSRASCPISSCRQIVLWLPKCHQEMSYLQEQHFMGTEYFIALETHWCPADSPIRNTHSGNTCFDRSFVLTQPKTSPILGGKWKGSTGQTFICEKTVGEALSEVIEEWCSPSHPYCQPGLFCSPSASWCGMNHYSTAWWSSKPWTHFLVLSNGETQRMWLIRESSSPWQIFSNGNGFWGLLTAEGEAAEHIVTKAFKCTYSSAGYVLCSNSHKYVKNVKNAKDQKYNLFFFP